VCAQLLTLGAAVGVALCSAGCREKPLRVAPLPPLAPPVTAPDEPLPIRESLVIPGERLTWVVRWRGMPIGRAEHAVAVGPVSPRARRIAVRSRFRTAGVARRLSPLVYDLTAEVALPGADGHTSRDLVHNIHEALAALRGWARAGAPPAVLIVKHQGLRFRVDVASPTLEDLDETDGKRALRVDCRAIRSDRSADPSWTPTYITLWLSTDAARVPLRIDVEDDGFRAHAQLIEREIVGAHRSRER